MFLDNIPDFCFVLIILSLPKSCSKISISFPKRNISVLPIKVKFSYSSLYTTERVIQNITDHLLTRISIYKLSSKKNQNECYMYLSNIPIVNRFSCRLCLIVYMVINKNQYVFRSDLFVIHGHPSTNMKKKIITSTRYHGNSQR